LVNLHFRVFNIETESDFNCDLTIAFGVQLSTLAPLILNHASVSRWSGRIVTAIRINREQSDVVAVSESLNPDTDQYLVTSNRTYIVWAIEAESNARPTAMIVASEVEHRRGLDSGAWRE
jgi:hypothetical protein